MNQTQIDGMWARSTGLSRHSNPHPIASVLHEHWRSGWEIMDQQVTLVLGNAEQMVSELTRLRAKLEPPPRTRSAATQPGLAELAC